MRGFLLLAFGMGLIWLGVQTARPVGEDSGFDSGFDSGGARGEGGVADLAQLEPARDASLDRGLAGALDPGTTPGEREWDPDPAPNPAAPNVVAAEIVPVGPATVEAVAHVPGGRGAPNHEDTGQGETGSPAPESPKLGPLELGGTEPPLPVGFRLGSPGDEPVELAELLLRCWIEQDPASLEAWLNDGERDLSMARRRLVASFWQAAAGSTEVARAEAENLRGAQGVTTAQCELLRAAGYDEPDRAVPAAIDRRDPLARAMRMVLLDDRAARAASHGDWPLAARSRSDLIQLELSAPWPPHRSALWEWAAALNRAQAHHRLDPAGDWPSRERVIREGDSLSSIRAELVARDPGLALNVGLIRRVNGVGKYIHPNDVLRIPTEPANVIVDLDARLCVYRHGSEAVLAWVVGIGLEGQETPTGTFQVGEKLENPSWMPQGGRQLPFGHEDNPLGTRWIGWLQDGAKSSYGFHGTWESEGIGERVSNGCVRLRNEAVEELFELLPVGSTVLIQM